MKKVLAVLLSLVLVFGSATGVMAKPKKFNSTGIDTQLLAVSDYSFDYQVPETIIAGEDAEVKVTLQTEGLGAEGYEGVRIQFSVSSNVLNDQDEVVFVGKDDQGNQFTFRLEDGETATWGPSSFALAAEYEKTTPWVINFPKPGKYNITFKLLNTQEAASSQNYTILEKAVEINVLPKKLQGFVYKNNISGTYYGVNGYRLSGVMDFADYEDEFIIVEGYPDIAPSIYMVKSLYVQKLTKIEDSGEVLLKGKLQKVDVSDGKDYYTLEGVRILEAGNFDNSDFADYFGDEVLVEIQGEVDEDEQGVRVLKINIIIDNNDEEDDEDEDENENEDGDTGSNGKTHGLLNALRNHLKVRNNGQVKQLQSTQRLIQLLESRGIDTSEFEQVLSEMEASVNANTPEEDYQLLDKMYQKKSKKYQTFVNGKKLQYDVSPINKEGRTLVPFRNLAEALGAEVSWNAEDSQVTVTKGETTIVLTIGEKIALVNGQEVELDVPGEVLNGRTLVPLRFLAEKLGSDIYVDFYPEGAMIVVRNK
ncbi:MAG: copper amine oxidase N-terminal domain-containing protein [Bacillota bacterium]